jgi:hypothetical protein
MAALRVLRASLGTNLEQVQSCPQARAVFKTCSRMTGQQTGFDHQRLPDDK